MWIPEVNESQAEEMVMQKLRQQGEARGVGSVVGERGGKAP